MHYSILTNRIMKTKQRKGFTLIELLIVVAIIGILAVALVPTISDAPARARDATRKALANSIITAIESYNIDRAQYPASEGGCLLVNEPSQALLPERYISQSQLSTAGNPSHPESGALFANCENSVWYQGGSTGYTVTVLLETQSGNAGPDNRYFQIVRQ